MFSWLQSSATLLEAIKSCTVGLFWLVSCLVSEIPKSSENFSLQFPRAFCGVKKLSLFVQPTVQNQKLKMGSIVGRDSSQPPPPPSKFGGNPFSGFCVILLTNQQPTNRRTWVKTHMCKTNLFTMNIREWKGSYHSPAAVDLESVII